MAGMGKYQVRDEGPSARNADGRAAVPTAPLPISPRVMQRWARLHPDGFEVVQVATDGGRPA